jgi:hypothetical protein
MIVSQLYGAIHLGSLMQELTNISGLTRALLLITPHPMPPYGKLKDSILVNTPSKPLTDT